MGLESKCEAAWQKWGWRLNVRVLVWMENYRSGCVSKSPNRGANPAIQLIWITWKRLNMRLYAECEAEVWMEITGLNMVLLAWIRCYRSKYIATVLWKFVPLSCSMTHLSIMGGAGKSDYRSSAVFITYFTLGIGLSIGLWPWQVTRARLIARVGPWKVARFRAVTRAVQSNNADDVIMKYCLWHSCDLN